MRDNQRIRELNERHTQQASALGTHPNEINVLLNTMLGHGGKSILFLILLLAKQVIHRRGEYWSGPKAP